LLDERNIEFVFTAEELSTVEFHKNKYPDPMSAVMPVLWMAQEKYGWLSDQAIKLVADTLNLSFAHVYGVATFYTQYFKKPVPAHLLEVCTCFSCGECGGYKVMSYLKEKLKTDEKGFSEDGSFWIREAECLGACDTAPVLQVTNGHYLHNLTEEKLDHLIEDIRNGKQPGYELVPLNDQRPELFN
jgi:NADH-quinone oxidoreductase subunit E